MRLPANRGENISVNVVAGKHGSQCADQRRREHIPLARIARCRAPSPYRSPETAWWVIRSPIAFKEVDGKGGEFFLSIHRRIANPARTESRCASGVTPLTSNRPVSTAISSSPPDHPQEEDTPEERPAHREPWSPPGYPATTLPAQQNPPMPANGSPRRPTRATRRSAAIRAAHAQSATRSSTSRLLPVPRLDLKLLANRMSRLHRSCTP